MISELAISSVGPEIETYIGSSTWGWDKHKKEVQVWNLGRDLRIITDGNMVLRLDETSTIG